MVFDGFYQCFICKTVYEVNKPDQHLSYCSSECQRAGNERGILFPFIKLVDGKDTMKKAQAKTKPRKAAVSDSGEVTVNSKAWKEIRARQYRIRLEVPSGVKPEDVPFQKKAMDDVDKLPVSEGGKGK